MHKNWLSELLLVTISKDLATSVSSLMASHECPTCGRADFRHERDMKAHHTIAHGQPLLDYQNPKKCPTCEETFSSEAGMKAHHKLIHAESISDSRRLSRSLREQAIERDNQQCQRCGVDVTPNQEPGPDFQLHHIIPFAAGGPDHPDNLITLCSDCHTAAHTQMRRIIDKRPNLVSELRSIIVGGFDD